MAIFNGNLFNVQGEQVYTTPGTYSFVVPDNVYGVSVVCVGGGGRGGGGGGGLGWRNYINVNPGQSYTVVVGAGGHPTIGSGIGGDSYFLDLNTVRGGGGQAGRGLSAGPTVSGGTFTGHGGGNGGGVNGSASGFAPGGGGGAGGYSGPGGDGGAGAGVTGAGTNGIGGGGGGGGGDYNQYSDLFTTGVGGGVGLYGQGNNGAGGSGGETGPSVNGQPGGNGSTNLGDGVGYGKGGNNFYNGSLGGGGGAVRIIWGLNRSFPTSAEFRPTIILT